MFSSRTVSVAVLALLLTSGVSFALAAQGAPSLSVTISSPTAGAVFNRGETATITASVTSGGGAVSGATVTATSPTGGQIALAATSTAGTYSGTYAVQATDPLGTWAIVVQAVSGSVSASASTSASISGTLAVAVTSPAASSDFNVGQTATVDATVTNQDGTAVPPSATVSFSSPSGAAVAMSVDAAVASGKTWTGTYTVQPSDVTADGAGWTIAVSASYSGNTGSAVTSASLWKSLEVGVSTYNNAGLTSPQTDFQAGQTVYVKASVGLHDGAQVTSGAAFFTITGTTIFSTSMPMTYSLTAGAWTGAYTVLSTDQTGAQTLTVTASDGRGNTGSGSQAIEIGVQGLTVSVTSPPAGTTLNRGEGTTITASVSASGTPATSATVTASSPSGASIALANLGSGVYSARYTVFSTDPTGTCTIDVQASQGGLTGSAQVAAAVSDQLKVAVSTWSSSSFDVAQTTFSVGQTVYVEAAVTDQDSTVVSTGTVTFELTGTAAASSPLTMSFSPSLDAWTGSYTVLSSDASGAQTLTVSAADVSGNSGTGSQQVTLVTPTQALAVSIVSPAPGTTFHVGDNVGLSATVTLGGSPFAGAAVTATSPTGAAITLTSAGGGAYAGSYMIASTDPTGTWTIRVQAAYGGQLAASQEQVTIMPTTTSPLTVSCTPSSGQPRDGPGEGEYFAYVCTATVGATATPPAGTVTFNTSSSTGFFRPPQGGCQVGAGGSCAVGYLDTAAGTVTITAAYRATPSGAAVETASTTFAIPKASTTTTLACVPGQWRDSSHGWVCTASVSGVNATGTVSFSATAGTLSASTCTLGGSSPGHGHDGHGDDRGRGDGRGRSAPSQQIAGGCSVSFTDKTAGAANVTATYSGDSNNLGSAGTASVSVSSGGLALSCSPGGPAPESQQAFVYRCYAVMEGASGPPHTQGVVAFTTSSPTGSFQPHTDSCRVGPGECEVTYSDTTAGTVTITAAYQADHHGASSSVSTTFEIPKAATTTALACRALGAASSWDCTAVVRGVAPTGTVSFGSTAGSLSASSCSLAQGQEQRGYSCSVTLTGVSSGQSATVSATYSGDGNNLGSSGTMVVQGGPASTGPSTSVTSIECRVAGTDALRCSATVAGESPTGQISWASSSSAGVFSSSTCTVGGGPEHGPEDCMVTYTQASSGAVTITASYSGDGNNLASSASVTLTLS